MQMCSAGTAGSCNPAPRRGTVEAKGTGGLITARTNPARAVVSFNLRSLALRSVPA